MQGQSISKLITACLLMVMSLYVVVDVMTSGGNALGRIYAYLLIGSALCGVLAPKGAFIYLLVLTAYLDMLKRMMIFDGGVSTKDLYNVLGIAPATMAGILANVSYSLLEGRRRVAPHQVRNSLFVIVLMAGLMSLSLIALGRSGRALGDAVNMVCYLGLFVVVPYLYRTPREMQQLYRHLVLIFLPAGLYMFYQSYNGLTGWEMDYVKSGMTMEIRQLSEVKFRPFGTMNSAAAASTMFGLLAVVALWGPWRRSDDEGVEGRGLSLATSWICFAVFITAAALTITRTGWMQAFAAMLAMVMFAGRFRTRLFYLLAGISSALLVTFSSWILRSGIFEDLESTIRKVVKGDVALRSATIGTFADRLVSYERLIKNGDLWTPFGWKFAGKSKLGEVFAHDAVSDLLIKFGYIPLGSIALVGAWGIWRMHQIVLSTRDPLSRRIALVSAACFVGSILGCLSTPAQLYMFPVNFLLWLFPSIILGLGYHMSNQPGYAPLAAEKEVPNQLPYRLAPAAAAGSPSRRMR